MPANYTKVYLAAGATDAVMIKLFLESLGIPTLIFEESAGIVYGLTVGPLAATEIWVPAEKAEEAEELLRKMENGELSIPVSDSMEIPPDMLDLADENKKILTDDDDDKPTDEST